MDLDMQRLNVWHRLGVVATVLWILGGGLWHMGAEWDRHYEAYNGIIPLCFALFPDDQKARDLCVTEKEGFRDDARSTVWAIIAIKTLLPIPLAWGLVYLVIWTCRWVWAGRQVSR
ncbi:MAG: hypothetical protein CMI62_08370 [Parvibaculum sp.]|nr:hypothetical protein [Parvibaculum sp.]|tara:strand:- start:1429 stop:1776 length:348 start_codon:yes stop_codon:yes gene_type:complete